MKLTYISESMCSLKDQYRFESVMCATHTVAWPAAYWQSDNDRVAAFMTDISHSRWRQCSILIVHLTLDKGPLAEKLRRRHIRLAIKPRYLRNHASQIKSYYWSLAGSNGRSFRIHHKKSPEAPPGGEITMTWYLTCKISSEPCIPDKKILWITIRKSWSLSDFYKKNSKY